MTKPGNKQWRVGNIDFKRTTKDGHASLKLCIDIQEGMTRPEADEFRVILDGAARLLRFCDDKTPRIFL